MGKPDFEELAHELWPQITVPQSISEGAAVIEKALRAAFDAGLDSAGHIAHSHGWYSMAYVEDEPPPDVATHNHACWAIRDAIRAEKSK